MTFTKTELKEIEKRINAKLEKSIVLDHYDPILNTLIFYTD